MKDSGHLTLQSCHSQQSINSNFFEKRNKSRNYLHFDDKKSSQALYRYICNPKNINSHAFYPFIHYKVQDTKFQSKARNFKSMTFSPITNIPKSYLFSPFKVKKFLYYRTKYRNINFPSHIDGNIYAYYAYLLSQPYEQFLFDNNLQNSILAFRKITSPNNDKKSQCNIDFCKTVFNEIQTRQDCIVLCFDISKFFDCLNHKIIKDNWCELLNKKKLPSDHYQVYKSLTKFAYVNKTKLYKLLGISLNNKHPKKQSKRLTRLCSAKDFREKVRKNNLIEINNKEYGIPQGSPISGILSNIYMMTFDKEINNFLTSIKGKYFRYCDDIICIFSEKDEALVQTTIKDKIKNLTLNINDKKTQTVRFVDGQVVLPITGTSFNNPDKLQYLGLTFDGKKVALRETGISKYHYKARKAIRMRTRHFKKLKSKNKTTTDTMYMRKLHTRYTYIGKRNYLSYVFRVTKIHNSKNVKRQMKSHFDTFNQYLNKKLK